jgi:hypothetical protein
MQTGGHPSQLAGEKLIWNYKAHYAPISLHSHSLYLYSLSRRKRRFR